MRIADVASKGYEGFSFESAAPAAEAEAS